MFNAKSLKTKVLGIAIIVGVLVALMVAMIMYFSTVKPVESRVQASLIEETTININAAMSLKVQTGIMGASSIASLPIIKEALYVEEREDVLDFMSNLRKNYAEKTHFQNIASVLFSADARMLVRSWDLESFGQDASNNPLIQSVMKTKQSEGSLGIGATGVGVVAISPVLDDGEMLGMVSMIQGLASVVKDFKNNLNTDWLLLVDKRYISEKYGEMPVVDGNLAMGENYLLANNNWFAKEVVSLVTNNFFVADGEASRIDLAAGKALINLPAYDEEGLILGRHIFVLDEQRYLESIESAMNSAWLALAGVVFAIFLMSFVMVISVGKMVIRPLQEVQQTSDKIIETGDFSLRFAENSNDEVGQTAKALNSLLQQVGTALSQANLAVGAIAQGDFSQRITANFVGDLDKLKQGVNQSADNITQVMEQFGRTMQALRDGDFGIEINCTAKGAYLEMMDNAQAAMTEMNQIITQVNEVMGAMENGEFDRQIEVDARGDMKLLKDRINHSMDKLNLAIQDITRVVVAQSKGDLTQQIYNEYSGDLDQLKQAVNSSLRSLMEIVSQAVTAANIVQSESTEVSRGAHDLSQRMQQQAAALEQTSATMHQMNSAVQNNTNNAMQAADLASKVQAQATTGEQVMQKNIHAMAEIEESSRSIGEIVALIDSIAFQTNLLALNAAVEAARAGENGRGFAVVAGEVRALAQKSADAARDIRELIDDSIERVADGNKLAAESGRHLMEIVASIGEINKVISQIASASREQAEGVSQVHLAINDIDSVTQQNAALVEETTAAAESMSSQAQQLNQSMAFFKTNGQKLLN